MAISSTTIEVQSSGNGVTTVFNFPHYFLEQNDLLVYITDALGNITLKTLTTHYSVSGAGVAGGGSVSFLVAPASGETVTIINSPDLLQESEFEDNSKFPALVAETAWDKLTLIVQRQNNLIAKSLSVPDGSVGLIDTEIQGVPAAFQVPRVNSAGDGLEWEDPDVIEFDSASPLTTKGDILTFTTTNARLAVGANGKVLKANSAAATGLEWGNAGGGGGSLNWIEADLAPVASIVNNFQVYEFEDALTQYLYASIRVPSTYTAGDPIKLLLTFYSAGTSGTALIQTQTTLIRTGTDLISSTTNQRTSTNGAVTLSGATADIPQAVILDLSSSIGQVNAVSVSPGDILLVRLTRDTTTDTTTSSVFVPVYGAETTFS